MKILNTFLQLNFYKIILNINSGKELIENYFRWKNLPAPLPPRKHSEVEASAIPNANSPLF